MGQQNVQAEEVYSCILKIMLKKWFDVYEHGEKGHSTECLFGHFHKREKQAQLYFQFLRKR